MHASCVKHLMSLNENCHLLHLLIVVATPAAHRMDIQTPLQSNHALNTDIISIAMPANIDPTTNIAMSMTPVNVDVSMNAPVTVTTARGEVKATTMSITMPVIIDVNMNTVAIPTIPVISTLKIDIAVIDIPTEIPIKRKVHTEAHYLAGIISDRHLRRLVQLPSLLGTTSVHMMSIPSPSTLKERSSQLYIVPVPSLEGKATSHSR